MLTGKRILFQRTHKNNGNPIVKEFPLIQSLEQNDSEFRA